MTYCLATIVDDGLVFVSDSRTNAGIDSLGTFSKMHAFTSLPGRFFTLLSAGNLATTQAVIARLERDIREQAEKSLAAVKTLRDAALYIGEISREMQARYPEEERPAGFVPDADFIFGGQIEGGAHALFHIYTAGNFYAPTTLAPYVQIGEQKYGKPILDRILTSDTDLETAARCGLVSMDSTTRSNASVGPPIEVMMFRAGAPGDFVHMIFDEDDPYLRHLRQAWAEHLMQAFDSLPPIKLSPPKVRAVEN